MNQILGSNWDDPQTQGLLGLAMSLLAGSGPSPVKRNFGSILGEAGMHGMQQYRVARELQDRQKERGQLQQMREMQLADLMAKRQREAELRSVLQGSIESPVEQALAGGGGPTEANALKIPQMPGGINYGKAREQLLKSGNLEGVSLVDSMRPKPEFKVVNGSLVRVDPQTGSVSEAYRAPAEDKSSDVERMAAARWGKGTPEYNAFVERFLGSKIMSPAEEERLKIERARLALEGRRVGLAEGRADNPPLKPLPPIAMRQQAEATDRIIAVAGVNADMEAFEKMIDDGKLKFGLATNVRQRAANVMGASTEESRNFASFKANMERLRNESLRLNKGVQTEGDAVRAWNELFENMNDTKLVKQRLSEIRRLNRRAAELTAMQNDMMRANYGYGPGDYSKFFEVGPSVGQDRGGTSWDSPSVPSMDWSDLNKGR